MPLGDRHQIQDGQHTLQWQHQEGEVPALPSVPDRNRRQWVSRPASQDGIRDHGTSLPRRIPHLSHPGSLRLRSRQQFLPGCGPSFGRQLVRWHPHPGLGNQQISAGLEGAESEASAEGNPVPGRRDDETGEVVEDRSQRSSAHFLHDLALLSGGHALLRR